MIDITKPLVNQTQLSLGTDLSCQQNAAMAQLTLIPYISIQEFDTTIDTPLQRKGIQRDSAHSFNYGWRTK